MKTLLATVTLGVLLSVVYINSGPYSVESIESTIVKDTQATQQPQREPYIAPQWVVNERGQRCIKQTTDSGDVITCG